MTVAIEQFRQANRQLHRSGAGPPPPQLPLAQLHHRCGHRAPLRRLRSAFTVFGKVLEGQGASKGTDAC